MSTFCRMALSTLAAWLASLEVLDRCSQIFVADLKTDTLRVRSLLDL